MRPKQSDVFRLINYFNQNTKCISHNNCNHSRILSTNSMTYDYAFEFKSSNLRFGKGVTKEVGLDLQNIGAKNVCLFTDKILMDLKPVKVALESLKNNNIKYDVYTDVRCEPTDESFKHAINYAIKGNFDAFLAVGGGSVMDTAKAANLYSTHKDNDFYDFVNAPIGKGLPVPGPLKPLIAVPTTTGTGSETTGVAVFDILERKAKTGIGSRLMTPNLALIDPDNCMSQPPGVITSSGFDVLCHGLESFTAISYNDRSPCPDNPNKRPAYQGSNPISDVWCRVALPILNKYFVRAVNNMDDYEARSNLQYAAAYAGMGFGTAGVHLCHGLSYSIAGLAHDGDYIFHDYEPLGHAIIPHGVSVVITAPSVFEFTCNAKPEKHREAAIMLGENENNIKLLDVDDISKKLRDRLLYYMDTLKIPLGLNKCGYTFNDIDKLTEGAIPQDRVNKLSPNPINPDIISNLYEKSLNYLDQLK